MSELTLIDSKQVSDAIRNLAWELYENSFPLAEQRTLAEHLKALNDPAFHADIILEEGTFVGILFYWIYYEKYCFIEHFAIDRNLRNGGYGRKSLNILLKKGHVTILEIDPPIDEISMRRQVFYERLGFALNPYLHIHPSYRPTTQPHELKIMTYPRQISEAEFSKFRSYSLGHVLSYSEK